MIFVDTSFWIALVARRDNFHATAQELLRSIGDANLLTTNHVRGETWTYVNRRYGHQLAVNFLNRLEKGSRITIEFVQPAAEDYALRWLRRHDERAYSFVDATSFAVMRALKIREALAFGGDFAAAGFVELRP